MALMLSVSAYALPEDTLTANASMSVVYDDNVFRLSSGTDPLAVIGKSDKSDFATALSLGVKFDKQYSNQRVMFSADVSKNMYKQFSFLDYQANNYRGAWIWSVGEKVSGSLTLNRNQSLSAFSDTQSYSRNVNTVDTRQFDVDWWLHGNWHLVSAISADETSNTTFSTTNLSRRSHFAELGAKYTAASSATATLVIRNITGEYVGLTPNPLTLVDSGYTERQQELKVNWPITGKSMLTANLMNTNSAHPTFSQRDFSANVGGVTMLWGVTDKTHLNASLKRNAASWWEDRSSYFVSDSISIAPVWEVNSMLTARLVADHTNKVYRGAVKPNLPTRTDVTQSFTMAADWMPHRNFILSTSAQHSQRSSNQALLDYSDNTLMLSAQYSF